jgi:hypothetical protein
MYRLLQENTRFIIEASAHKEITGKLVKLGEVLATGSCNRSNWQ